MRARSLTDCALCVSGNGRLVSGILMIWKGRVQIAFLMFLMKAGQTGFLTGLKNTACMCVAYIPGSISSCCLFSISTWAVFLAGYIEKQAHGGLLKLLISALVAMSKALKCQALLYTACVLTLSIRRVSLSCGALKWHRRLNARPWTGNRQDVFGVMPVLWVKLL